MVKLKKLISNLVLVAALLVSISPVVFAKTIKTKYFEIDLPERFTIIEGNEDVERYVITTEGTYPFGNIVVPGGSSIVIEYFIAEDEEEFEKTVSEAQPDKDLKDLQKLQKLYENTNTTKSYYKLYTFDQGHDDKYHIHTYEMFQKKSNLAVFLMYFDTNEIEQGKKAIDDIYNQIKLTNNAKTSLSNEQAE